MRLYPIRSDDDYRAVLAEAERLFDQPHEPDADSPDGAYFDALITLIEAYERKHFAVDTPDPIEAIKFRMDQQGLTVADLEPYIVARNRIYEVPAGKRPLKLATIRRLNSGLGIPAGVLVAA